VGGASHCAGNGEAGNTQIVMLGLRNRSRAASGWNNDTTRLEHSGSVCGPEVVDTYIIPAKQMSWEERQKLRAFLESHITDVDEAEALGTPVVAYKPSPR
jgi:hypothetical protein